MSSSQISGASCCRLWCSCLVRADALRLRDDLNVLDERLSAAPAPEQLQSSIDEAEAALEAETVKRVSLERSRTLAADGIETARTALLQYPDLWSPAGELLVDLDSEQAAVEERAKTVGEQIAEAQGHLNNARNERDALRESEARDAQVGAATDSRLNALVKGAAGAYPQMGRGGPERRAGRHPSRAAPLAYRGTRDAAQGTSDRPRAACRRVPKMAQRRAASGARAADCNRP